MNFLSKTQYLYLVLQLALMPIAISQSLPDTAALSDEKLNKLQVSPVLEIQQINQELKSIFDSLKQGNSYSASIAVQTMVARIDSLNTAEQYLLLVAQALLENSASDKKPDNLIIIQLLEQAKALSEGISKEQLSQPEFLQLHLLLAQSYAEQQQFDLAYLEKKAYLKKYYLFRKNKRIKMIASLEQSFEVDDKKAKNALLQSQNKLKERRVAEVQKEKQNRQYNFTLIIATAIVFVLLFLRQLRIRKKLIKLSRTDTLTGLANRSALFEHGEQMVARFFEQPSEFSVLLLDLDHFKKINDNFGHHVGDEVLIKVAELIKETMRSRDVFSRLGGEEFVALLPFADCNKAKAIAMRINDKIAQYDFSSLMMKGKVTISIGVATMNDNQRSFDDVLHSADLAMYQAKEEGRNTVVCYQDIAITQERRGN